MSASKATIKPGVKTTEFWASIPGAAALIETAQSVSIDDPLAQTVAVSVCIVGAVFLLCYYTMKRTEVKSQ